MNDITASRLAGEIARLGDAGAPDFQELAEALSAFVLALHPPEEYASIIDSICRLATSDDPAKADAGRTLLFSAIAEPLGDSFEPRAVHLYDELFADVIALCRHQPAARKVDACLTRAGVLGRHDLLRRRAEAAASPNLPRVGTEVRKVLVLSRVTIGADVAVTSVVLQKLARLYPGAELCLIGSSAPELVSAGHRVRGIPQGYERRGDLLARLRSWVNLVETCERELAGLRPEQCVVVDPDSRLTQLGLLPLVGGGVSSVFFESRSYQAPGLATISELTAAWLEHTFGPDGGDGGVSPRVTIPAAEAAQAEAVTRRIRQREGCRLVGVNLGVGGNPRKRIGGSFELDLVRCLLADGNTVILDYGAPDETERIEQIVAALRQENHPVAHLLDGAPGHDHGSAPLLTYRGGLSPFAALLARTDCYIGYDSAFQHIAAAQGVPVVDIFVSPPNDTFSRRWRPAGPRVRAIEVSTPAEASDTLSLVSVAYRSLQG